MKKLENKVAVITGGNSGIGLAVARLFADQGAKVGITGRNPGSLRIAEKLIGHGAVSVATDVSDLNSIDFSYKYIHEKSGGFDVLIVNAGMAVAGPLADFTEDQFDVTSDTNFKGTFFSVQRALPYLNDGASVILMSSASNEKGFGGYAAYAATKAAIRSLARSFSTELMPRKIRVNAVSPGAVDTPFYGRAGGTEDEIQSSKNFMAANMIPAKRLANPDEIAKAFLYLASEDSGYMIGSELVIDGGVKTI